MEDGLLSPRSDLVFKLIFGDQRNVDILTAFLKSVLDLPEDEYDRLTIVDPHLKPDFNGDKSGILDIKIHTKSGKIIEAEMQISNIPQMRERIVFYAAKMITEQIGKGGKYNVIKRVISIVITDYRLIPENERYHNRYRLVDPDTGSQFTDLLEVDVLELPKLPGDDNTELWEWMMFLKSERKEDLSMLEKRNPQIRKAVAVLKELSQDERTRLLYEEREKAWRDEASRIDGAIQEGRQEGRQENKLENARNFLLLGIPIETIAKGTGLSVEEIRKLQ